MATIVSIARAIQKSVSAMRPSPALVKAVEELRRSAEAIAPMRRDAEEARRVFESAATARNYAEEVRRRMEAAETMRRHMKQFGEHRDGFLNLLKKESPSLFSDMVDDRARAATSRSETLEVNPRFLEVTEEMQGCAAAKLDAILESLDQLISGEAASETPRPGKIEKKASLDAEPGKELILIKSTESVSYGGQLLHFPNRSKNAFAFLFSLAGKPGECVSYDDLRPDIGTKKDYEVYRARSVAANAFQAIGCDIRHIIRNKRGFGYILILPKELVHIRKN